MAYLSIDAQVLVYLGQGCDGLPSPLDDEQYGDNESDNDWHSHQNWQHQIPPPSSVMTRKVPAYGTYESIFSIDAPVAKRDMEKRPRQ
jgi:hypothetical protein